LARCLNIFAPQPANIRSRIIAGSVAAFTPLLAVGAASASTPEPVLAVRAELNAPRGCPSADTFLEEILKRAPGARAASAAEAARRYRANVERAGARFRGEVASESLSRTDGKAVDGATCSEVITALAIVVALSLDADAIAPSEPEAPVTPDRKPPAREPVSPRAPAKKAQKRTAEPSGREWGLAAEGALLGQALPTLLGGGASVFVRTSRTGVFAPSIRLGGGLLFPVDSSPPLELRMPFLLLDFCPSRFTVGPVHASPCVHTTAGLLSGRARRSRDTGATQAAALPFMATGPEVRLELQLERVLFGVRGSLLGVWSAPSFRRRPSGSVVMESGALAVEAGAGFGVIF